ncbi:hypothetical protein CRG98_029815 [Punica granatum]|uniref:Folate receptor-like domain-containing protein n=1 Tax=Punica granatum TaxID=22663 RepID=A0A2I0J249_PUNGR|nr:hypothetical protein CRG98_029815 [Punica granatum]
MPRLSLLFCSFMLLFLDAAKAEEVCVSKGGRFPPYSSEGRPPRKVSKGPKDLTLCRVFRRKTCCDVAQTHAALVTVRKLALTGDATDECVQLWELLECSICDPRVGVQPGPPRICASFCDRVFQACSSAYFSTDAITQGESPQCSERRRRYPPVAILLPVMSIGWATEWVSNGTDLCQAAGFAVKVPLYPGEEETSCYGSKASLDSIADSWNSNSDVPEKLEKEAVLGDFMQQMKEMPLRKKVFWAVGGMVLTAGLLVIR